MSRILAFILFCVSDICMGQERISGEFTTKHIIWPHIVQLNGPAVETNEGSETMIVKGGYLANAVLFFDSTNWLEAHGSLTGITTMLGVS